MDVVSTPVMGAAVVAVVVERNELEDWISEAVVEAHGGPCWTPLLIDS